MNYETLYLSGKGYMMRNEPYYHQDDPTEPVRQPSPPNGGQQGDKLILGSFQDASRRPERKPYQYPPPAPYVDNQARTNNHSRLSRCRTVCLLGTAMPS